MAIAAVPAYLGHDFSGASPGLRFGMYLPVWEKTSWKKIKSKVGDLTKVSSIKNSKQLMSQLRKRQALVAATIHADQIFCIEALAVAPFATGLGNEHPLENGFAFLNPYGLPYLAGSGVKGVLRKAAYELAGGLFGDTKGWTQGAIDAMFGFLDNRDENSGQRGALVVWDVLPEIAGENLKVEVITAHQNHYLQGDEAPHESGQPNPINFLAVPPGSHFDFHIQCDLPYLARIAPTIAAQGNWKMLVDVALNHAFEWLGFGAKTAVGYGAMQLDIQAAKRRHETEAKRLEAEERKRLEQEHVEKLAVMLPADREIQLCLDERADKNIPRITVILTALRNNRWEGEMRREITLKLREFMRAEKGRWKESTEAKKPEKDKDYQNTKFVMGLIDGG